LIVIVCGLPGTGKTTVAKNIAPLIRATILSTDKIRKELFPTPTYWQQERRLVYEVMMLLAQYLQEAKVNCVLDATFNAERSRTEVIRRLSLKPEEISIIECICQEDIIFSRLKSRKHDYSDADITVYNKMKKIFEPINQPHIVVDTSDNLLFQKAVEIAKGLNRKSN
jgi:predicted kinase